MWELVTKRNKVMEWKGGEQRGEHKESESKEAALCDPRLRHKWQRQTASGILLLKDLSPSSHPARPAWQRPFCPFAYNANTLLSRTMHHRAVFGSDLRYKRGLMQRVRTGQAGLIAARALAWFSCWYIYVWLQCRSFTINSGALLQKVI